MTTKADCIKQKNLEKLGYKNTEDWMKNKNNIYMLVEAGESVLMNMTRNSKKRIV